MTEYERTLNALQEVTWLMVEWHEYRRDLSDVCGRIIEETRPRAPLRSIPAGTTGCTDPSPGRTAFATRPTWGTSSFALVTQANTRSHSRRSPQRPPSSLTPVFARSLVTGQFEVDLLRLRTREGMAVARAKGRLRGRLPKLSPRQQSELRRMHATGEYSITDLAELFSISRPTVYRTLQANQTVSPLRSPVS